MITLEKTSCTHILSDRQYGVYGGYMARKARVDTTATRTHNLDRRIRFHRLEADRLDDMLTYHITRPAPAKVADASPRRKKAKVS